MTQKQKILMYVSDEYHVIATSVPKGSILFYFNDIGQSPGYLYLILTRPPSRF